MCGDVLGIICTYANLMEQYLILHIYQYEGYNENGTRELCYLIKIKGTYNCGNQLMINAKKWLAITAIEVDIDRNWLCKDKLSALEKSIIDKNSKNHF